MNSLEELQTLIHKKYGFEPAKLDPNSSLREAGVDSLTLVEFIFEIEDHFGISVPEQYNTIDTLAEMATVIDELRSAKAGQTA